ncbi:50S ribosomal protein L25/general stress protein Ctc [Listeria floridensis FSL S10-1187]|uniref:Large ribosomal subunit protein bL25 n=1 Tax=Listeria floridensis FSL S10-1187 TaxID=1265817 RepID=A0ABP3AW04_9LIST|nr:50S ribosomal protein L25/general stress protein Ctc [Listeria floridensis]EUJ28809.1 50S ribosomal protein L25/general stress protein Ctc [Listeria floridensis FSL S10-1187]
MATTLEVQKRDTKPHSQVTEVREAGRIPAIIYGYQAENIAVSVDALELIKAVREHGRNEVFAVTVDGSKMNVLLHQYQKDPLKDEIIHLDLLAVDMSEEVETEVRIDLVGDSVGVKSGGVLQQVLYEVIVKATPDKLPEAIEVDISGLEIGDSLAASDIPKNADYEIITDGEEALVTIAAPRVAEEPTEGAEAPEPEAVHGSADAPVE